MADKLPSDFNPDAYAAAYPDVALSGLGGREHYLRFGRLLGRSASGKPARQAASSAPPVSVPARPAIDPELPTAAIKLPAPSSPAGSTRPPPAKAIIDRPADFRAEEIIPSPAPVKTGGEGGRRRLDDFMPSAGEGRSNGVLHAYAKMVGVDPPVAAEDTPLCDPLFQSGGSRITNAWFAEPKTLRLMFAAEQADAANLAGWSLRAFQALPGNPGDLRAAGQGISFPERGPCFVDVVLSHPLMPVFLELVGPDAETQAFALLPFPSLLPGGLHWAEAKAVQTAANPMDSFWSLSQQYVDELVGGVGAPARAIATVEWDAGASETVICADVRDWIVLLFGIPQRTDLPTSKAKAKGLHLVLPPGAIPTIAALVSRRLASGIGPAGPYLVAEAESCRPVASIAFPHGAKPPTGVPRLEGGGRAGRQSPSSRVPIHLAIVLATQNSRPVPMAASSATTSMPEMAVLLDAADAGRTEALVQALQDRVGATGFELWVRSDGGEEMRATLDRVRGAEGWLPLDRKSGLRDVALAAQTGMLLTIDDRVRLDGDTLQRLAQLLESGDDVASASCLLLRESVVKKHVVLQPGAGGIFPSAVSFIAGPAMAFSEPDVSVTLRDLTYPVIANTMALTLWRRGALADLPAATVPVPRGTEDIGIGLELTLAGHRNLCTTTFAASISGDYARRDAIDPLGTAVLRPGQWQDLLGRVTLVRELF